MWGAFGGIRQNSEKAIPPVPLSVAAIRNLKPREKAYKVSDFDGLFITVKPTRSRLWHFKYRIDGKEKLPSLGIYPAVCLAQARSGRDDARALIANNIDPSEVKKERKREDQERRGITFEAQAVQFMTKADHEGRAAATMTKNKWLLDMAIADFGKRPISEISAPMILKCLRKVEAKGNYETAKRLRAKIGGVFRYSVTNGHAKTDPTYALRDALIRPIATPRAAITDPIALGGLMRAKDDFHGQTTTKIVLQLMAILAPPSR